MAWDDTPPQASELQSNSSWDSTPPTPQELNSASSAGPGAITGGGKAAADANFAMEGSPAYPNSNITDPTINDASTVLGGAQTAKLAGGLGLRAAGALSDSIIPALSESNLPIANMLPNTKNIVPSIGEASDEALIKSMRGRVSGMNPADARISAQAGRSVGLDDIFSTSKGRREALKDAEDVVGGKIGATRKAAGNAPYGQEEAIRQDIERQYGKDGVYNMNAIKKPLADVGRLSGAGLNTPPTYSGLADASTYLNHMAGSTGIKQADNAMTDVANANSRLNNQNMMADMSPQDAAKYQANLDRAGALYRLNPIQKAGEAKTMNSAGGAGGGGLLNSLITNTIQRPAALRAASKGLDTLHTGLTELPNAVPAATTDLYSYLANDPEARKKLLDNEEGQ